MNGDVATDHNGMRYALRNALVADGHHVNFVGSRNNGTMGDNQVEGWGGYRIDQVSDMANLSLPYLPNLVLINAGSNDVYQNHITGMADRMGQLIDKVLNWVPGTTVIVGTLMPNDAADNDATMKAYNANLIPVVKSRHDAGEKVFLVNCDSSVSVFLLSLRSISIHIL
jgi:lysophospholipase L1-like esterase